MDETVLDALTAAAMLPKSGGGALAQDLMKIRDRMDKAAASSLAAGDVKDNPTMTRFLHAAVMTADAHNEIPLREDDAVSGNREGENLAAQSKRYEAPYTTVPRIV